MIKKKNSKIINVSLKRGIDYSKAETKTLNPSTPDIVLKGLKTQKDQRTPKFKALLEIKNSVYPDKTMTKSSMFQASHM